jgi:hypothetical protein
MSEVFNFGWIGSFFPCHSVRFSKADEITGDSFNLLLKFHPLNWITSLKGFDEIEKHFKI